MQHWPSRSAATPKIWHDPPNFLTEPKVREENLEGHVKSRGLQQTYLALETSQDQSHQASKLIRSEAEDQFGGLMWLVEWSLKTQSTKRQLSWLCTMLLLLPLCKRLLIISTPCAKFEIRESDLGSQIGLSSPKSSTLLEDGFEKNSKSSSATCMILSAQEY